MILRALSGLLLCPGAGIATSEALVLGVTGATTERAGERRGGVGKGRSGRGRTRLVFERNERVLQLLERQGVVQQQRLTQRVVFGREGSNQRHEDQLIVQLRDIKARRTEGLHVRLELRSSRGQRAEGLIPGLGEG